MRWKFSDLGAARLLRTGFAPGPGLGACRIIMAVVAENRRVVEGMIVDLNGLPNRLFSKDAMVAVCALSKKRVLVDCVVGLLSA